MPRVTILASAQKVVHQLFPVLYKTQGSFASKLLKNLFHQKSIIGIILSYEDREGLFPSFKLPIHFFFWSSDRVMIKWNPIPDFKYALSFRLSEEGTTRGLDLIWSNMMGFLAKNERMSIHLCSVGRD
jgi:hypothetical protein